MDAAPLDLVVDPDHPDAGDPLLAVAAAAFNRAGAQVRIDPDAGNLTRPAAPGDGTRHAHVVEAEGLPNLLHEWLHCQQGGTLADDYGIDYALIPFDTAVTEQRLLLWHELACCTLSCERLQHRGSAAVAAWFADQLGILHHFYGFDGPAPFFAHVEDLLAQHGTELDAVVAAARAALAPSLRDGGVPLPAPPPLDFRTLWERFRNVPG